MPHPEAWYCSRGREHLHPFMPAINQANTWSEWPLTRTPACQRVLLSLPSNNYAPDWQLVQKLPPNQINVLQSVDQGNRCLNTIWYTSLFPRLSLQNQAVSS